MSPVKQLPTLVVTSDWRFLPPTSLASTAHTYQPPTIEIILLPTKATSQTTSATGQSSHQAPDPEDDTDIQPTGHLSPTGFAEEEGF